MNILFHCSEYPPFKSGGIGSATKIVAEGLAALGNDIVVCGCYPELPEGVVEEVTNGVRIYRFGLGSRSGALKRRLSYVLRAAGMDGRRTQRELDSYEDFLGLLIDRHRIQILELTDFYEFNYCHHPLRYHTFDIPVVMRLHGSASYLNHFRGIDSPDVVCNDRHHFERAGHLSSVSRFALDFTKELHPDVHFRSETVIHNAIEDSFIAREESPEAGNDPHTILYLGKLTRTKGAYSTVRAFGEFLKGHPGWKLLMMGSGDAGKVLRLADKATAGQIELRGFCRRDEIRNAIDGCSFACLPSFFETFGMTPLEVMARGKAVIFTCLTSGPEVIRDGEDGVLVNPSDVPSIAEKMAFLSDNPDKRREMAASARARVCGEFSTSSLLVRFVDFYSKIIG